jgi:hypothetical protein
VLQSLDDKVAERLTARRPSGSGEGCIGVPNSKGGSRTRQLVRVILGTLVRPDQVRRHHNDCLWPGGISHCTPPTGNWGRQVRLRALLQVVQARNGKQDAPEYTNWDKLALITGNSKKTRSNSFKCAEHGTRGTKI